MLDITDNLNFIRDIVIDNICNTMINHSNIHGFGLFATKSIQPNCLLCVLDGQLISKKHMKI